MVVIDNARGQCRLLDEALAGGRPVHWTYVFSADPLSALSLGSRATLALTLRQALLVPPHIFLILLLQSWHNVHCPGHQIVPSSRLLLAP